MSDKPVMLGPMGAALVPITVLAFLLSATPAEARGGYGFRNFMNNPPKVGEKAPLLRGVDIKGKSMDMKDRLGETHLILIFGALT